MNNAWHKQPCFQLLLALLIILLATTTAAAAPRQQERDGSQPNESSGGIQPYKWVRNLPGASCPWAPSDHNCHASSPALADINADGHLDIVLATNNGHVVAYKHNGDLLWDKDISPAYGMAPNTNAITSSPAVADIDRDGKPEVVVGTGSTRSDICTQGGLVVLDDKGNVEPGWPYLADDHVTPPSGCRDAIYSSPALGDLDNDGDLEIVAGGFDKRIYAWHHNGTLVSGFPPDSYLKQKLPTWEDLEGRLADTIWSSPALADLDGDGYLDIIIGTDEGNLGDDWHCPYELPPGWYPGYCGGSIYALNRHGQLLPGFPRYILDTVQSTPAVADLNADGSPEIIIGASGFYYANSPDHPTYGFRLHVLDRYGADLPNWEGGKWVGGPVPSSPSIGDISGDSRPEIIVGVMERKELHAYTADGNAVSGFPKSLGQTNYEFSVGSSTILGDYDGDNKMEIFFNQEWSVTIVDGNGELITASDFSDTNKPHYFAEGLLMNNPAVGDLDNDGHLELVASNSRLVVWELNSSSNRADWPRFKRDAAGTSYVPAAGHLAAPEELYVLHDVDGDNSQMVQLVLLNLGGSDIEWSASAPDRVSLSPSSGTFNQSQIVVVTIDTSGLSRGEHDVGNIVINASSPDGGPVTGSPHSIPVTVYVSELQRTFMPLIGR